MKEKDFASKIGKELKKSGFYMKIPDSYGMDRFIPIKNFDAMYLDNSVFCAIEYKVEKGLSFNIDRLRASQVAALSSVKKSGGLAFILVYVERSDIAILWDIDEFINISTYTQSCGKKAISVIPVDPSYIIVNKLQTKGRPWDVSPIRGAMNANRGSTTKQVKRRSIVSRSAGANIQTSKKSASRTRPKVKKPSK